jgi:hypothetical protein
VSAGQGRGVGQAYDGWWVVSQSEFQQWVLPESNRFVLPSFVFTVLSSPPRGLG